MDFEPGEQHRAIVDAVSQLCARFGDDYWRACDRSARFPDEFYNAFVEAGWLGVAMPEAYGGAGLGISEAALIMRELAACGGMTAASAVHINMFGPMPIAAHGTDEQKARWLPPLIAGKERTCFGVTEPDAGLDTGNIATRAVAVDGGYRVTGQKIWTSTAQRADRILLLARTTPREKCIKPIDGLSLFYAAFDQSYIEVREIEKLGRSAVDSNQIFIDGLFVPKEDLIGEEGQGFRYILDGLNPERILIAMEAIGIGRDAIRRAANYARERVVFGQPIGRNQSIQHPLAESWAKLEAAELLALKAAWAYDNKKPCGPEANAAKYLAAEAAHEACFNAVKTHGGMGYAKEYHVERLLREVYIPLLAPVSSQMILNYISERVLGLPRSY